MRPVLASVLVLLALPASAAAQAPLPPLEYAAPIASVSRGAPLTFAVRTAAPDGTVVVRVSGHEDVDADGMLTGPDGTWLDETAAQATADLAVWSVPANSVLRQRPGHYYWQAYLTGDAANGAEEPIGPVQELTVTLPFADKGRGNLFPKYGRRGVAKSFYLSSARFPESVSGTRFQKVVKTAASRWGLKTLRWTSAKAGVQDGFNVAGFSSSVDAGVLGVQTDLRQARQGRRERPRAERRRELERRPGLSGARPGRPRERRAARARPYGGQQEAQDALHQLADDRGAGRG